MKKVAVILLSIIMSAFLFAGCGAKQTAPVGSYPEPTPALTATDSTDPDGYKSLFKERFAEARKVALHYTAAFIRGEDGTKISDGGMEYYKCGHYSSKAELRAATAAVFTDSTAQGFYKLLDSSAYIDRDGGLYIAPFLLFDVSPWQAEDTMIFQGKTVNTFLWDSLTVSMAVNTAIMYTLDWYQTYPGNPITSPFTLTKDMDGVWRFNKCFADGENASQSAADRAQVVLDSIVSGGTVAMTLKTADGLGGGRYEVSAEDGNGPNRVFNFENSFNWSYTENEPPVSSKSASSLKVEAQDGTASIQCWQGSNLVLCTLNGESFRLSAGVLGSEPWFDTIFAYLRFWYDEAEFSSLRGEIVILDKGQSYQEIAQAWTDANEGAMLRATPGSKFACTYVKSFVTVYKDAMDSWFSPEVLATKHFYFDYNTILVPENEQAKMWLMVGNTVDYEGNDAPAGALEYYRMGPMYLTQDGWRCDGAGTGP